MKNQATAGQMRHRIEIQTPTSAKDATGYGQLVETWTTLATVWAKKEHPAAGNKEQVFGDLETTVTRVHFTIWHRDGLSARHRVRECIGEIENLYDILTIQEIGYRDKMLLITEKRTP